MRATDLMLGDWVLTPLGTRKVYDNSSDGGVTCSGGGTAVGLFSDFELKPIPLTPDILLKNGWKWHVADAKFFSETWVGSLLLRKQGEVFRILAVSDYDDEDTNNTPFTIRYVHELQHVLRLMRINKEIEL